VFSRGNPPVLTVATRSKTGNRGKSLEGEGKCLWKTLGDAEGNQGGQGEDLPYSHLAPGSKRGRMRLPPPSRNLCAKPMQGSNILAVLDAPSCADRLLESRARLSVDPFGRVALFKRPPLYLSQNLSRLHEFQMNAPCGESETQMLIAGGPVSVSLWDVMLSRPLGWPAPSRWFQN
jgi:hypothetical protein